MKRDTDLISYANSNQLALIPCCTALRLLPDTEGKRIIIDLETMSLVQDLGVMAIIQHISPSLSWSSIIYIKVTILVPSVDTLVYVTILNVISKFQLSLIFPL